MEELDKAYQVQKDANVEELNKLVERVSIEQDKLG